MVWNLVIENNWSIWKSNSNETDRGQYSISSPVQVILFQLVVSEDPQYLHILAEEAGRQQAMNAQLQALFQGEGHPLQRGHRTVNY